MNAIHALSQLSYGPVIDFGHPADVSASNDRGEVSVIQSRESKDELETRYSHAYARPNRPAPHPAAAHSFLLTAFSYHLQFTL